MKNYSSLVIPYAKLQLTKGQIPSMIHSFHFLGVLENYDIQGVS